MSRGNKSLEVLKRNAATTNITSSYSVLDASVSGDVSRIIVSAGAMSAAEQYTIGLGVASSEADLLSFNCPAAGMGPVELDVMIPKNARLAIKSDSTTITTGIIAITYLN